MKTLTFQYKWRKKKYWSKYTVAPFRGLCNGDTFKKNSLFVSSCSRHVLNSFSLEKDLRKLHQLSKREEKIQRRAFSKICFCVIPPSARGSQRKWLQAHMHVLQWKNVFFCLHLWPFVSVTMDSLISIRYLYDILMWTIDSLYQYTNYSKVLINEKKRI